MRIGSRWLIGQPAPPAVPETMLIHISEAERAHPSASAWTLTWLEGRPVCALDELLEVRLTGAGSAVTEPSAGIVEDEDDSWLLD